jgi:hypothetical protein
MVRSNYRDVAARKSTWRQEYRFSALVNNSARIGDVVASS